MSAVLVPTKEQTVQVRNLKVVDLRNGGSMITGRELCRRSEGGKYLTSEDELLEVCRQQAELRALVATEQNGLCGERDVTIVFPGAVKQSEVGWELVHALVCVRELEGVVFKESWILTNELRGDLRVLQVP